MDHRAPEYKNPTPTVDIIVEYGDAHVVLIERKNDPKGLALPGGFIDEGESAEDAARREAKEELGVDVTLTEQFYTYSDPGRDPRQHVISTVYIARVDPDDVDVKEVIHLDGPGHPFLAGDDAKAVHVIEIEDLAVRELVRSTTIVGTELLDSLVFDHSTILLDYFVYRFHGIRPELA